MTLVVPLATCSPERLGERLAETESKRRRLPLLAGVILFTWLMGGCQVGSGPAGQKSTKVHAPPISTPEGPAVMRERVAATRFGIERWRGMSFRRPVRIDVVPRADDAMLAGWYEPANERLVVVEGRSEAFSRGVLLHELHHALQDQHFDLEALHRAAPSGDAKAALQALIEGEAMLAVREILGYDFERHAKLPEAGAIACDLFEKIHRYRDGMRFVRALRDRGGWGAVDSAFGRPPRTSAEILHPERYPAPEPERLAVPLDARWVDARVLADRRLGEISLRWQLVAHEPSRSQAGALASELRNDRMRRLEAPDGVRQDFWDLRFASEGAARRYLASGTASVHGWSVKHQGRDVRLERASDPDIASEPAGAVSCSVAGTPSPVADGVLEGTYSRVFDAGPANPHTATYVLEPNRIRYRLVGGLGNADYVINRDAFVPSEGRFVGHTESGQHYVLFVRMISGASVSIYKQAVDGVTAGLDLPEPPTDTLENHGWNVYRSRSP